MTCPDCGGMMQPVSVVGFDDSSRCQVCGGILAPNWVVNNIADGKKIVITPLGRTTALGLGSKSCPVDGTKLSGLSAQNVPDGLHVQTCLVCSRWWFPHDELFEYAQAAVVKQQYLGMWHKNEAIKYAFPALVLVLLLGGVVGGVVLSGQRQRTEVEASVNVSEFQVRNEAGVVVVQFKARKTVESVEIMAVGNTINMTYVPNQTNTSQYEVRIANLPVGMYVVRILEKEYLFEVN